MSIDIVPSETLTFDIAEAGAVDANGSKVELIIKNPSDKDIAFKVKTTKPKRYLVKPNQGLIKAGEQEVVAVVLQQKDCEDFVIEKNSKGSPQDVDKDKFLVQSTDCERDWYENTTSLDKTEKPKAIKQYWDDLADQIKQGTKPKDIIKSRKLKCEFNFVAGGVAASAPAAAAAPAPARAATAPPAPASPSKSKSAPAPAPAAEPASPASNASNDVLTEVMQLRKKYDDLVQFTVQLTTERERIEAERNSLKDQLDKAKKAAPKAAAAAAGGAVAQANAPAGFNLMHAVILAFISFVVGRFLA